MNKVNFKTWVDDKKRKLQLVRAVIWGVSKKSREIDEHCERQNKIIEKLL